MSAMQLAVSVSDQSQIGEARRQAVRIAHDAEFGETDCGRVALAATELATNLVRYASGGEMLLRSEACHSRKSIEILSVDRGPGIADVSRCLVDGYSTGGTSGTGLGAVQRLCTEFDIFSTVPQGTVVYCRIDQESAPRGGNGVCTWGVVNRPAPYESECGDTWRISEQSDQLAIILLDGLGHGPAAAAAAAEGAAVFDKNPFIDLPTLFTHAHHRMHGTRGAAVAAAQVDLKSNSVRYLGIGNISGTLRAGATGASRGLVSHNGTVGLQFHKAQELTYDFPVGGLLIMHTDGLQSRWSFDAYPALPSRHPGVIAGVLYRDFCRGRDDVTVAVVRISAKGVGN